MARTARDPSAPKSATSAQQFFNKERREVLRSKHPDMSSADVQKSLAEEWRDMSADKRAPYVTKASKDKARFSKESAAYVPDPAHLKATKGGKREARSQRWAPDGRGLWGTYSRVVKPPTTDERIDELRDELRHTNSELFDRISQLEALLRRSLTGEGGANSMPSGAQQRRAFGLGSFFAGSGNREAFEALEA